MCSNLKKYLCLSSFCGLLVVSLFASVVRLDQHAAGFCFVLSLTFCKECKLKKRAEADKIINTTRTFTNNGSLLQIPTCNGQEESFGTNTHSIQENEY